MKSFTIKYSNTAINIQCILNIIIHINLKNNTTDNIAIIISINSVIIHPLSDIFNKEFHVQLHQ